MKLGYALSGEEHPPLDLVHNARAAERAGFGFALLSDHFHPWLERQGQAVFACNTPAVCRASYVHPTVLAAYRTGRLPAVDRRRGGRWLRAEEAALLQLLG